MQINEFIPELEKRGWTFEYKVIEQSNDGIMAEREYLDKEYCYAVKIYNDIVGFGFVTPSSSKTLCHHNVVESIKLIISEVLDSYGNEPTEYDSILNSFLDIFLLSELESFINCPA